MGNRIAFTFDLEDHRPSGAAWAPRYRAVTGELLDWMDDRSITATVFVVGSLALEDPGLVREVAARGHEVGLHNWHHTQLTRQTPDGFRDGVRRGRAVLEDLLGEAVVGFRAPTGSLVPASAWAVDVLLDEGYAYSSSVVPGHNPLNGFPGAPNRPFTYRNGLAEFPAPMAGIGPAQLPHLGGTYLRLLPRPALALLRALEPPADGAVLYCHPYDFDPDEPFWWVDDVGPLSPLLWVGRRGLRAKLERLVAGGTTPPLRDRLVDASIGPVFDPFAPAPGRAAA
jgi:polysaccharide deacetylase family protein (PEP-CTERM system associated)